MNSRDPIHTIAGAAIKMAADDWVGLWVILSWVEQAFQNEDASSKREITLKVVRELLRSGLKAGDSPYALNGYREWPNQAEDAVLSRIDREWRELGRSPTIGDIAAFG